MIPYLRARRTVENGPESEVELRVAGEHVRIRLRVGTRVHQAQVPVSACRQIEEHIAATMIPLAPAATLVGIGNGFELQIGSLPSCAIVSWISSPPAGWEACATILNDMLSVAEQALGAEAFRPIQPPR
jgi:hypothetical protein